MIKYLIPYLKKGKIGQYIVFEREIGENKAKYKSIDIIQNQTIKDALNKNGIENLYLHQAKAYRLLKNGENILITTPTASGKTLCYNLPILEDILENRAKALYLFPMKALGYDQKEKLLEIAKFIPDFKLNVQILDGDTSKVKRRRILSSEPDIIITNIDIVHYYLLPKMDEWYNFISNLKYIVIDELHVYRGVFGAHFKNIFDRLKRFIPDVQVIASSATVGNPLEFTNDLLNINFNHITESGAPTAKKYFLLINPEDIPPANIATYLIKTLIESGIKTLCFTKSRMQTESIYKSLINNKNIKKDSVSSYRAGFLPEERREIEKNFRDGNLKAVISTSAFELGIDIGGIDATILVGYPGSLMSLWQRAGRSGRHGNDSLIILIPTNDALDQYFVKYPEKLFNSSFEDAIIDKENELINKQHIFCAAYEKPISVQENYYFSNKKLISSMVENSELFYVEDKNSLITLKKFPHKEVDLRNSGHTYTITFNNKIIGTNSAKKAYTENYKGAIYLHRGETFIVDDIDHDKREIKVYPAKPNYYTRALIEKETDILETYSTKNYEKYTCKFVRLKVKEQLKGYEKIEENTGVKLGKVELEENPIYFETKGIVIEFNYNSETNLMGSIHALEHGLIAMIPLKILCDRNDIGGISYPEHPQTNKTSIFVYDGYPGGIGIANRIFNNIDTLLNLTLDNIKNCNCENGCPACIYSPKCGSGNYPLDKNGAIELLNFLLNKEVPYKKNRQKNIIKDDVIIFDIETKYSADDVGGWKNAHKMGIAILVAYSYKNNKYFIYDEKNISDFKSLLDKSKVIIGFNIINFDLKVLTPYIKFDFKETYILDILTEIKNITGRRFSLDNIASSTLNTKKSANGLQSIKWFKEGKIDKIIEYCKKDVDITKSIFEYGIKHKKIYCNLKDLKVEIPVNWDKYGWRD
ncbi:DEAD/DEAH box helicase domain protein [Deferribacter desulfuricans SSM1]|uniref:DEAD/DEAH box helicase domain protein n=1 Tax=Deferribacter desulfuricans (strain DSM 14783 / JCM 11476 / NBRC 101012 / SSM1) TaxID=639282 RepID=D3P8I9_DEFDS|nr:DEAD/DEAH box helicase [Deferribacter desulfuricans]BAI81029.1 DEAD/DEAH box helicase domain protein [Deferribacter desulfuricans SSM1]